MEQNPVGWFEIYVDDIERATAFYQTVLSTQLQSLTPPGDEGLTMMAFDSNMEAYGCAGALVQVEGFPAGGNSTLVYFSCDDCAEQESRVQGAGGKVERSKMSIGEYGFISLAFDTEGNLFGLHSLK